MGTYRQIPRLKMSVLAWALFFLRVQTCPPVINAWGKTDKNEPSDRCAHSILMAWAKAGVYCIKISALRPCYPNSRR